MNCAGNPAVAPIDALEELPPFLCRLLLSVTGVSCPYDDVLFLSPCDDWYGVLKMCRRGVTNGVPILDTEADEYPSPTLR